jgi:hypothetical protein
MEGYEMALSVPTRNRALKLLKNVDAISLEAVARNHAQTYGVPVERVRTWIPELKKWLVLCAVSKGSRYTIFGNVDKLWHTFITFTYDYMKFCRRLGVDYIHHVPPDVQTGFRATGAKGRIAKTFRTSKVKSYDRLLEDLSIFGPLPVGKAKYIWPKVEANTVVFSEPLCMGEGSCTHGCGCCRRCSE